MYRLCPSCKQRISALPEYCPMCGRLARTIKNSAGNHGRNRVLLIQVIVLPVVVGIFFLWMFLTESLLFSPTSYETNEHVDSSTFIDLNNGEQGRDEDPQFINEETESGAIYETFEEENDIEEEVIFTLEEDDEPSIYIGGIIHFGGIYWRVLDILGTQGLVISENVIFSRPFHHSFENVTWETSEIRRYLNSDFIYRFNREEQARVSDASADRVFLLSIDEVLRYFGDSSQMQAGNIAKLSDEYDKARVALNLRGEPSWWWLRTSGNIPSLAAFVNEYGHVYPLGFVVSWSGGGIRPAMWLELEP